MYGLVTLSQLLESVMSTATDLNDIVYVTTANAAPPQLITHTDDGTSFGVTEIRYNSDMNFMDHLQNYRDEMSELLTLNEKDLSGTKLTNVTIRDFITYCAKNNISLDNVINVDF